MTVCYFGIYDSKYSRNRIIIRGLRENGVKVYECRTNLKGFNKFYDLTKKYKHILDHDYVIVGFPGQTVMWLIKILTRKKIIFDCFTSLYDSMVQDRQSVKRFSSKALYYFLLDWFAIKMADKIIVDTKEHLKYLSKTFKTKNKPIIRVLVGAEERNYSELSNKKFIVHFHGSYIPLQGVEYIMNTVRLLEKENVLFNIVGTKINKKFQGLNFHNVNFFNDLSFEDLNKKIRLADVCLGIFGNTQKAYRVIPNKVYEAIAWGKPVITANTPAIQEVFKDKESILLCDNNKQDDLVDKIIQLQQDDGLKKKISQNAYKIFLKKLTPKKVVQELVNNL